MRKDRETGTVKKTEREKRQTKVCELRGIEKEKEIEKRKKYIKREREREREMWKGRKKNGCKKQREK